MTWMQRLKRVFAIEIERCGRCGGKLRVIASIEEPALIERILAGLQPAERDAVRLIRDVRVRLGSVLISSG